MPHRIALVVVALLAACATLTCGGGSSTPPESCREAPDHLQPRLISQGQPGELLLEWSGASEGVNKWQYRAVTVKVSPREWDRRGTDWKRRVAGTEAGDFTDIPGGGGVRSYRLTGVEPGGYLVQMRGVQGQGEGVVSDWVGTWVHGTGILRMESDVIAEGDGSREWAIPIGECGSCDLRFVIPAGVRLQAYPWESGGEGHPDLPAEFLAGDVWHDWGLTTTISDEPTGASITIGSYTHYVEGPDGELESWSEMVVIERDTGCATGGEAERVNAVFDALFASVPQE